MLMGGWSKERAISLRTGQAVLAALRRQGFDAVALPVNHHLPETLRKKKIGFAYNALHGSGGEDGTVQGLLEILRIPYTGSGVLASGVAMNKICAKRLFQWAGLPTPSWIALDHREYSLAASKVRRLGFPVVVKPASQGSAIGVSIVGSPQDLRRALTQAFHLDRQVLIERYIRGTEITVGILGGKPLPVQEIVPASEFYDYQAKYAPGGSQHLIPARLPRSVQRRAQVLAVEAFQLLGARAVARVDFIVNRLGEPLLLELNTIPGMTETSLLPEAAQAVGISFDELVVRIAELSLAA